jgi:hypothetical protein
MTNLRDLVHDYTLKVQTNEQYAQEGEDSFTIDELVDEFILLIVKRLIGYDY